MPVVQVIVVPPVSSTGNPPPIVIRLLALFPPTSAVCLSESIVNVPVFPDIVTVLDPTVNVPFPESVIIGSEGWYAFEILLPFVGDKTV